MRTEDHLFYRDTYGLQPSSSAVSTGLGTSFQYKRAELAKAGYAAPMCYRSTPPTEGILRAAEKRHVSHIIATAQEPWDFDAGIKNLAKDLSHTRAEFALRISTYRRHADIFLIDNPEIEAPKPELMDYTETVRSLLSYDMVGNTQEDELHSEIPRLFPKAVSSLAASLSVKDMPNDGYVQKLFSGFSRVIREKPSDLGMDEERMKTMRVARLFMENTQNLEFDVEDIVKQLMELNDSIALTFDLRLNTEQKKISIRYLTPKAKAGEILGADPVQQLFEDLATTYGTEVSRANGHLR